MSRRVWTGILAGVVAATVLLGVAGAAYRAGEHREVVTRTVGDGDVVRVIGGYGYGYGHPWGFGFFLFPLFMVLLVFLLVRAFRGWGPRYRGGGWYGYGYGPCGPGVPGAGGFEEQHRKAHAGESGEVAEA